VSIFGRDLAVDERRPSSAAFELAGASVTLDGQQLPLLYAAPHQINAQLPYGFTGAATLQVNTRGSAHEVTVQVNQAAPGILQSPLGFRNYPAIWSAVTESLVTSRSPARAGEYVTIYLVGLGAVAGSVTAGEKASGDPLLRALDPTQVQIGSVTVTPSFAGLTPGFAGLYQINVRLPSSLEPGAVALRILTADIASEPVTLFVSN
jgi:uncharacterized protein (TIGR03437 family)